MDDDLLEVEAEMEFEVYFNGSDFNEDQRDDLLELWEYAVRWGRSN